jgi:ankyrin repeat protein
MVLSYLSAAALQDGDTALILAVKFEHTSIVQALLDAGANQSDLSSVRSYLQCHRALYSTHYSRMLFTALLQTGLTAIRAAKSRGMREFLINYGMYTHRHITCPAHFCVLTF